MALTVSGNGYSQLSSCDTISAGGTWDAGAGILTMQHTDIFFNGGPYAWESTYVRQ